MFARIAIMAPVLALAACQGSAPEPTVPANDTAPAAPAPPSPEPTPSPSPTTVAAGGAELKRWLTGSWSYDASCGSDYGVHFNADGTIHNYGDIGRWKVEGGDVIQTISETQELGMEPTPVNPPQVARFQVEQVDADNGVILHDGRRIPIKRC